MDPFLENSLASSILAEIRSQGPPGLGPARPRAEICARITRATPEELLGGGVVDRDAAACVRAGLLLFADDLDASHRVSQAVETADGSYWHGIMHRREPDYSNSKYWFRRVGRHPVFEELAAVASSLPTVAGELAGGYDPFRVVDLVSACENGRRTDLRDDLLRLQEEEMLLLLAHCYRTAAGR